MSANLHSLENQRRKRPRRSNVPFLEKAINTYIRERINDMQEESLF